MASPNSAINALSLSFATVRSTVHALPTNGLLFATLALLLSSSMPSSRPNAVKLHAPARRIYENAIDLLSEDEEAEQLFVAFAGFEIKGRAEDVYKEYVAFEKQHGDTHGIEDSIVRKMRLKYDDVVRKNPFNYDSWFDYKDMVREVYERAIANVPPAEERRYWQRYIYLWECLKLIPHKKFSFEKIWLMVAQFEIGQRNLKAA